MFPNVDPTSRFVIPLARSFTNKQNRVGDSESPCVIPWDFKKHSDNKPLIFGHDWVALYKDLIIKYIFPSIPLLMIL